MLITTENGNKSTATNEFSEQMVATHDVPVEQTTMEEEISCWKKCGTKIVHFKVEPVVFAVYFCNALAEALYTDLIVQRTCANVFNFPAEKCSDNMTDSTKNIVQPYVSKIVMGRTLIEALFPAVVSLFIGPWMDVHGRKTFLILPCIGIAGTAVVWLGLSYIKSLPPYYFLLGSFPVSLSGGLIALQACAYSYIADTTTTEFRAIRMGLLGLFMGVGVLCGYLVSTPLSQTVTNNLPLAIFGIGFCISMLAALFTIFIVPESVEIDYEQTRDINKFKAFFKFDHIKQSIKVFFTKRARYGRVILILVTIPIFLSAIIEQGERPFIYLVAKTIFSWTVNDFNHFRSVLTIVGVCIGAPAIIIFKRGLKFTDLTILNIIALCQVASAITLIFTKTSLEFYIGNSLGAFIEILRAFGKTKISYTVQLDDIGKIFAVISTLEAIAPLIASPIYTALFDAALKTNVLYMYILSGALALIILFFLFTVKVIQWKHGIIDPVRRRR